MTPEGVGALIDRYGLPLAILGGFLWLLLTRRLVLGSEFLYVDERRKEEREGRLLAEAALKEQSLASARLADAIEQGFQVSTDTILDAIDGRHPEPRARDARR